MHPNNTTNAIKLCECGCGQPTKLSDRTRIRDGITKGQPLRFIAGHGAHPRNHTLANPSGLCMCGCGEKTPIAKQDNFRLSNIKGQPVQFVHGHNGRKFALPKPPNPSGFCMCGCGQKTNVAKETTGKAGIAAGEHYRYILGHSPTRPIEERFWSKVAKRGPDDCWIWLAGTNPAGYGLLHGNNNSLAHRVSWTIHHGPIPDGMLICHHCNNPPCCNPAHLFLGSHTDNAYDMYNKGRKPFDNYARGESAGGAKLTNFKVLEIRNRYANGEKQTHIAKDYGVTQSAVWAIVSGKTWRHI